MARVYREKALQQLAKGEGEGNRSEIYLPGDIEGANTSDTWFNAFQTFLVTKGFLPITALAYWFQRVILFFRESFQGIAFAIALIQDYIPSPENVLGDLVYAVIEIALNCFDDDNKHPVFGHIRFLRIEDEKRDYDSATVITFSTKSRNVYNEEKKLPKERNVKVSLALFWIRK
eukprot:CAMPEP_0184024724 /NCGR_PEP_ID=MMETSP0954-20121128/12294_1 /TAXON_ID=627963 /ORGANISM="Aplanochytrium sp, Strain PBS07" /LENGTH=173 /DNA_ID=CAMNT_0026308189 /DNA_START=387 /DNA_END=910 /DNA_ORIENTATION=+